MLFRLEMHKTLQIPVFLKATQKNTALLEPIFFVLMNATKTCWCLCVFQTIEDRDGNETL